MRRVCAVAVAGLLVVALVPSAAAKTPASNAFTGSFDFVDPDTAAVVGHVTATFNEAVEQQHVTGGLTITWTHGNPRSGTAARTSTATLLQGAFWAADFGDLGHCGLADAPHDPSGAQEAQAAHDALLELRPGCANSSDRLDRRREPSGALTPAGFRRSHRGEAERAAFVAGSGIIGPGTIGPTTDGSDGPLPRAELCSAMQESAATLTKQLLYR